MAIVRGEGVEGLTMRRLGEELGVSAMAAYRHVSDKDELLRLVADNVIGSVDVSLAGDAPPIEVLRDFALAMRRALRPYRGLARYLLGKWPTVPSLVRLTDAVSERLTRDVGSRERGRALASVAIYVFSQSVLEDEVDVTYGTRGLPAAQRRRRFQEFATELGDNAQPGVRRLAATFGDFVNEAQFVYGLDCLLAGIEARAGAED
jgi:AcrR family transcriptional regulator